VCACACACVCVRVFVCVCVRACVCVMTGESDSANEQCDRVMSHVNAVKGREETLALGQHK